MPIRPGKDESQSDWMSRCVPEMIGTGDNKRPQDQAVAICLDIWRNKDKDAEAVVHKDAREVSGLEFILSDETKDRMGDIIRADGWDLKEFKRNPIALFSHRPDFPIGTWKNLRVENKQLLGKLEPAPDGTSPRIDEIVRLVRAGVLKAVSVGFAPIERKPLDPENRWAGTEFIKQALVETSIVAVGANPNSLAIARSLDISAATQALVFTKAKMEKNDAIMPAGEYADFQGLDEWAPMQARQAKLWFARLARENPYNPLYKKLHKLMEEIEAVRTIRQVSAEHGSKKQA